MLASWAARLSTRRHDSRSSSRAMLADELFISDDRRTFSSCPRGTQEDRAELKWVVWVQAMLISHIRKDG